MLCTEMPFLPTGIIIPQPIRPIISPHLVLQTMKTQSKWRVVAEVGAMQGAPVCRMVLSYDSCRQALAPHAHIVNFGT